MLPLGVMCSHPPPAPTALLVWLVAGTDLDTLASRPGFGSFVAVCVVTGIGAAHCAGMKGAVACDRVNTSNWSKFDHNGHPIRDANGKIKKGPNYQPPVLDGLY